MGLKTVSGLNSGQGKREFEDHVPRFLYVDPTIDGHCAHVWGPQGWDLIFRRDLNDQEVDRVLLLTLNAFPGVTECPYTPIWKMHKKVISPVKSCYWSLNSNQTMEME